MKIAVYCSANSQLDPDFYHMTEELGRWMAQEGHTLVFGGTDLGLMETIARAVHDGGGHVIGVVPSKVEERGRTSPWLDVHIPCDNLSDRKQLMEAQSDVFIALPGGVGTLDEIFNVVASDSIGYHNKRVILFNMKGFWDSLIHLMDDLQQKGVIREGCDRQLCAVSSLEELKQLLA
jgi:hypothetical protein